MGGEGKERATILTEEVLAVEGWRDFSSEALSRREIRVVLGWIAAVAHGLGLGARNLASCWEEKVRFEEAGMAKVELRPPRVQRMEPEVAERR